MGCRVLEALREGWSLKRVVTLERVKKKKKGLYGPQGPDKIFSG